jgi:hypothetical protein
MRIGKSGDFRHMPNRSGIVINRIGRPAAGDIKALRVKVTSNAADWPDYVFSATYQLPGLLELEDYINKQQHLPGVPSAKEVKKEGSVDLGGLLYTV